jgi:hypothetical protein
MRFSHNGPSIPDRLLTARDEGRVVIFCGAGVSRAKAGLVDFFGLAAKVIEGLGASGSSPARRILQEAQEVEKRAGLPGLISADNIFGVLERDFETRDIEYQVATALKPGEAVDLSAHQTIVRLSQTPDGRTQLVTTNFDRLLEDSGKLQTIQPPSLPKVEHGELLDGVIHSHGVVNKDYTGADNGSFVLSSAQFGNAYLAHGWATSFFKAVLEKYVVLFIGYAADDPPVKYLLEALGSESIHSRDIYAFQSDEDNEVLGRWRQKGVTPIPYDNKQGDHGLLWRTLELWAIRADNPQAWLQSVIANASKGPEALSPFERGQVKHVVSTLEGARQFADSDNPLPGSWLCVFDPIERYRKPGRLEEPEGTWDPFSAYGLDDDIAPSPVDPNAADYTYQKREVPSGAWSFFEVTDDDIRLLDPRFQGTFRGYLSKTSGEIPNRMFQIGRWLAQIATSPQVVWWASHQTGLHPRIQQLIEYQLHGKKVECPPHILEAWEYLFEAWSVSQNEIRHDWFDYKRRVKLSGWNEKLIRDIARAVEPYISVSPPFYKNVRPPMEGETQSHSDLARFDVEYPDPFGEIEITDEWLEVAVRYFRSNLERAFALETELGGYGLYISFPINREKDADGNKHITDSYTRTHGLGGHFNFYLNLFRRLAEVNRRAARDEMQSWRKDDKHIFARLRIWTARDAQLLTDEEAGKLFDELDASVLWDSHHQRDLMLSMSARWNQLPKSWQECLEQKLLEGPPQWHEEEEEKYAGRKSWWSLERIVWLQANGCKFTFDYDAATKQLKKTAPDWKDDNAIHAVRSLEGGSGWVKTDKSSKGLIGVPIDKVLDTATELTGRKNEFFVEHDPFAGFVHDHPIKAYGSLSSKARIGEYPEWAWRTFLIDEGRKDDSPRLMALIAARLLKCPPDQFGHILRNACDWLNRVSASLVGAYQDRFEELFAFIVREIGNSPDEHGSSIISSNRKVDWTSHAINSPAGKLAEALMDDPRCKDLHEGQGFPNEWLNLWEALFALPDDHRCHAFVIAAHNLAWFYFHDKGWTEKHLLKTMDDEGNESEAIWFGFLWGLRQAPPAELLLRMKDNLFKIVLSSTIEKHDYQENLAALMLFGWGVSKQKDGARAISNEEMRDMLVQANDSFRNQVLWLIGRWSKNDDDE